MNQDVLTPKEKALFAQSRQKFELWSENHTSDEIEIAIAEINDYVRRQDAQIDEQLAYQRDSVRQKRDAYERDQQAQLDFIAYHPEFLVGEPSATILSNRVKHLMLAGGLDPETTPRTVEMLETAFRQLVNEQRIDWNPRLGNPWARVEYKRNSEPEPASEPLTEQEIEAKLESGELTLEDVREMADRQLAEQNQNPEVEHSVIANSDRSFALSRVPSRPESDAPVTRERGFAAGLYIPTFPK